MTTTSWHPGAPHTDLLPLPALLRPASRSTPLGSGAARYGAGRRAWTPQPSRVPSMTPASMAGKAPDTRTWPTMSAAERRLGEWVLAAVGKKL